MDEKDKSGNRPSSVHGTRVDIGEMQEAHNHTSHSHEGHGSTTHEVHSGHMVSGHGAGGHGGYDKHAGHDPNDFRRRFWLSLILTLPVLYFSSQLEAWFGYTAYSVPWSAWVGPILGTVLYFYGGSPFLRGSVAEFKYRRPGMMSLIALAITVAYAFSLAVSLGFPGKPFFWELTTLIDIMLLGHWLEMKSVQQAGRALEALAELIPTVTHRVGEDGVRDVSVQELREEDLIVVFPGEQIPADGVVVEGSSSVGEAFLTGESKPVTKTVGEEVVAGAINNEGVLKVRVLRTGAATTLSQIVRLVKDAQSGRSRFQDLADRAASWLFYVAVVAGLSAFVIWLMLGEGFNFALAVAVTTLVIACPHALGLAIPLVTTNATAMAAGNGILVKNREGFERAWNVRVVAFDKTGTLTEGRFAVHRLVANDVTEEELLRLTAALEATSSHPLAQAIVEAAKERGVELPEVSDARAVPGQGIVGKVDGETIYVGRPEWLEELSLDLGALKEVLLEAEGRGESVIVAFTEKKVFGILALADQIRESAREAVRQLLAMGIQPVMVTGDAEAVGKTVAGELGIQRYFARVLPKDKARIVGELKRQFAGKGRIAFVGDGINDAPALVEADLGVAIGAGTNVAIESADLVLMENDPVDVVRALRLARATYGKMVQNLLWATGYNVIAIPLAAGVAAPIGIFLSPAIGAVFMSISTIIVSLNAMSLRRVRLDIESTVRVSG